MLAGEVARSLLYSRVASSPSGNSVLPLQITHMCMHMRSPTCACMSCTCMSCTCMSPVPVLEWILGIILPDFVWRHKDECVFSGEVP